MMKRLCAVLGLIVLAALPTGSARAAEAVKTRAAEHERYGRIAFDWPAPVAYDAKVEGDTLTIHFERGLETVLAPITDNIGSYVESASLTADGTTLSARLKRAVTLKTFTEGNTIAIDLVDASAPARKAVRSSEKAKARAEQVASGTPALPSEKTAVAIRFGTHEGYRRLVLDWKNAYTVTENEGGAHVHFPRLAEIDTDRIAAAIPGVLAGIADDA